jgi:predicted aminopeptidase
VQLGRPTTRSSPAARSRARRLARARACLTAVALAAASAGCLENRYVIQAGFGQAELWARSRPIDRVIADPRTDERTRILLGEVENILEFAGARGLAGKGNYRRYVELDRPAVVWFMTASAPLAFEAETWSFPIAGNFPYLGWFDFFEAREIQRRLEADGLDVYVRGVQAYSTGGYFRDPVLSTMLSERDDAFRSLANVLFHELTHANVFIRDQATYNESLASFVGDEMTTNYLTARFGVDSAELSAYRAELEAYRRRGDRMRAAYRELDELYQSDATDARKRAGKARILQTLEHELALTFTPNNASLIGFRTYNAGIEEFEQLYETCGRDWRRFLAVTGAVEAKSFSERHQEDLAPVLEAMIERGCR